MAANSKGTFVPEVSPLNKTSVTDAVEGLSNAADMLYEARAAAAFIRSMAFNSDEIHLVEDQAEGFYVVMRDILTRAEASEKLILDAIKSLKSSREGES